jgi:hypothetical protein
MGKPDALASGPEAATEPTTPVSFGKRDPKQFEDPAKDRRRSPRRRQYKAAKLVFNDNQSVVDCILRDISGTGARVQLDGWFDCPAQVLLKLSNGLAFLSDVVWSRDNQLGLHFREQVKVELLGQVTALQGMLDMAQGLQVELLRRCIAAHHHFDDDNVTTAGEALTEAHERMIEALRMVLHTEERKHRPGTHDRRHARDATP